MKLQSDSDGTYEEAYIYQVTWRDINTGEISTAYIAHTNCIANLPDVATQFEALFSDMTLTAIKEIGFGYILTEPTSPEEPKPK